MKPPPGYDDTKGILQLKQMLQTSFNMKDLDGITKNEQYVLNARTINFAMELLEVKPHAWYHSNKDVAKDSINQLSILSRSSNVRQLLSCHNFHIKHIETSSRHLSSASHTSSSNNTKIHYLPRYHPINPKGAKNKDLQSNGHIAV